jgi:hypothetical protein
MNVGRYLDIGDKEVAVTFSALQQQQHDGANASSWTLRRKACKLPIFVRHQSSK